MIKIVSLKGQLDLKPRVVEYAVRSWKGISDYFFEQLDISCMEAETVQDTFVMLDDDVIVGFYQFLRHEPIRNDESTPWLSALYIDEHYRGDRLSELFLLHGRIRAGKLGYEEVYISTDFINFFEKFGFKEIGLDLDKWGYPTKIYTANSLLQ